MGVFNERADVSRPCLCLRILCPLLLTPPYSVRKHLLVRLCGFCGLEAVFYRFRLCVNRELNLPGGPQNRSVIFPAVSTMTETLTDRDSRFRAQQKQLVRVELVGEDGQVSVSTAQLCDLSQRGAKLQMETELPVGTGAVVRFADTDGQFAFSMNAAVCWTRAESRKLWTLGCRFDPAVPAELISQLVDGGVLERRSFGRRPLRLPLMVRGQLESQPMEASIVDISAGGFCLLSKIEAQNGTRLLLSHRREGLSLDFVARAMWRVEAGDQCLVGCEFLHRSAYQQLMDLEKSEPEPVAQTEERGNLLKSFLGKLRRK